MSNTRYNLSSYGSFFMHAKLLYISLSRFGTDWHSTLYTHNCLEIFYCVRGNGRFYIAGNYMNVGRDDIVIINPAVEYTEVSISIKPLEYIVLGIENLEIASVILLVFHRAVIFHKALKDWRGLLRWNIAKRVKYSMFEITQDVLRKQRHKKLLNRVLQEWRRI